MPARVERWAARGDLTGRLYASREEAERAEAREEIGAAVDRWLDRVLTSPGSENFRAWLRTVLVNTAQDGSLGELNVAVSAAVTEVRHQPGEGSGG